MVTPTRNPQNIYTEVGTVPYTDGIVYVKMKTPKRYTDGTLFLVDSTQPVEASWGQTAVENGWASYVPITSSPDVAPRGISAFAAQISPPLNCRAVAGNAKATVYFQKPLSGLPSRYLITALPGNLQFSAGVTGASEIVTCPGLVNGVTYTFTVQAVTATGTGVASAASNAITPTNLPSAVLPTITAPLVGWYSATQQPNPPSNGVELPTWNDLSGNNYNMLRNGGAGTGGTWVTSWSSGKPAVQFNGATPQLYNSNLPLAGFSPFTTIAVVYDSTTNAGTATVFSNANTAALNASARVELTLTGTPTVVPTVRSGRTTVVGTGFALSAPQTAICLFPGSFIANNVAQGAGAVLDPAAAVTSGFLSLGSAPANLGATPLTGRIAEVLVWAGLLTSSEQAALNTYLNTLK